jgi:uncharacterized membrane protein YebE (DUF533 family)
MIDINGILGALQGQGGVQGGAQPHAQPGAQPQQQASAQPQQQAGCGLLSNPALVGGGGVLAGLAGGMLMGKGGRKLVGKAAKYGAVAALGGLAYHAISRRGQNNAQAQQPAAPAAAAQDYGPAPANTPYLPAAQDVQAMEERARSLLRAMIAAAKCDGAISPDEQARISRRMSALQLDPESRAFVEMEMARPFSIEEVVAQVTCPEHAAEIYAASLVAIDSEGAVERAYLAMLAARLRLDDALVGEIHAAAAAEEAATPQFGLTA